MEKISGQTSPFMAESEILRIFMILGVFIRSRAHLLLEPILIGQGSLYLSSVIFIPHEPMWIGS